MTKKLQVHVINPFWDASGGAEWQALCLYDELKPFCDAHLWTENEPHPLLTEKYPINKIHLGRGKFPKKGVFVFVGTYFIPGNWVFFTFPDRIIVHHCTFNPSELTQIVKKLSLGFWGTAINQYNLINSDKLIGVMKKLSLGFSNQVEITYSSELVKRSVNYPGIVELTSPFDLSRFIPIKHTARNESHEFVIGRLSRDSDLKHHEADIEIYRELATEYDCQIRIMGGTYLKPKIGSVKNITLLPANTEEPHTFLQSLDCFYYRTADYFTETLGRVVFEAMACELPVVCYNRGGYIDYIDNGRNGFIFNTKQEALEILLELKKNPSLRASVGKAARKTVEDVFSSEARKEIIDYYLH